MQRRALVGDEHDDDIASKGAVAALLDRRIPDLHLSFGDFDLGWIDLASFANAQGEALRALLADQAAMHSGMDLKAQGAFVFGRLAGRLSQALAAMAMTFGMLPSISPADVGIRPEQHRWEHDGKKRMGIRFSIRISSTKPADVEATPEAINALFVDLLRPAIEGHRVATGLSPGALWRLAADMLCWGFLHVGEQTGEAERARSIAAAVMGLTSTPLWNPASGFQHVALTESHEGDRLVAEGWFLRRGGCCRWYTCPEGELCSVCVLRPQIEQQMLLREQLTRRMQGAAHS